MPTPELRAYRHRVNRVVAIICIICLISSGAAISTYLITRAKRGDEVCQAVQSVHSVLSDLLTVSRNVSIQSLEENPRPGVTEEVINNYYEDLFKSLEPIDVSC